MFKKGDFVVINKHIAMYDGLKPLVGTYGKINKVYNSIADVYFNFDVSNYYTLGLGQPRIKNNNIGCFTFTYLDTAAPITLIEKVALILTNDMFILVNGDICKFKQHNLKVNATVKIRGIKNKKIWHIVDLINL